MATRLKLSIVLSFAALFLPGWAGAAAMANAAQPRSFASLLAVEAGHEAAAQERGLDADGAGGAGHVDYNQPPIAPNRAMLELFLFSWATFGAFLFLARKLAWLPLIKGLDAREARVNRALAEAEAARIQATKLLVEHQQQLDAVTEEVKAIIAQARGLAEQEKARIVAEAEAETNAIRDKAVADIHAAREDVLSGLDDRIDSQVITATQHVLG